MQARRTQAAKGGTQNEIEYLYFMGVLTTAYAVSPLQMRKIRADQNSFRLLFGIEGEPSAKWKVETYEFGKHFEEKIGILRVCGYEKTFFKLNFENYYDPKNKNFWNYEGYNIWSVTPAELNMICAELENASFEKLKAGGLNAEATDYFGQIIPAEMYEYHVGDIEEVKGFFRKTFERGDFLIFATV